VPERVTTGIWIVSSNDEAFISAWSTFATWANGQPGAGTLRLARDTADPQRYVSFAAWASAEAVQAWKSDPEFKERLGQVLHHVDEFHTTELDVVAAASQAGSVPVDVHQ
jgi:heme-degrading monooxygenase HmoA